ncbi:MAG: hypothetical protein AB4352_09635 [Hormoscilla sp.]
MLFCRCRAPTDIRDRWFLVMDASPVGCGAIARWLWMRSGAIGWGRGTAI